MKKKIYFLIFNFLFLFSCSFQPDYKRPEIIMPEKWTVSYSSAVDLSNAAWWTQIGDPVLDNLIKTAINQNLDILIASARINQYLGILETTHSQFFPQIGADFEKTSQRVSGISSDLTKLALSGTWEIDFWGRIKNANDAAKAQLFATEQARKSVLMTIVINITSGYITLRGLDRQLEIALQTEKTYLETLELFKLRYEYGVISKIELSQAQSLYEIAKQSVFRIESQIKQQENLISVLLGNIPGKIPRGNNIYELIPPPIPSVLPSALLERRPDIIEAEQNLMAANAQIGVAKAAYFPNVNLTALLSSASDDISRLFTGNSEKNLISGNMTVPLFTFGSLSGQVAQSESIKEQAILKYRQIVLNAFKEVEDALIKTKKGMEESLAQRNQVEALETTAQLSRLQFEEGAINYLNVLDAERSLFTAKLDQVQKNLDVFNSLIFLYKAVGGGWINIADQIVEEKSLYKDDIIDKLKKH